MLTVVKRTAVAREGNNDDGNNEDSFGKKANCNNIATDGSLLKQRRNTKRDSKLELLLK